MKSFRKRLSSAKTVSATSTCLDLCTSVDDEQYCEPVTALLHVDAHDDGGLACNNQQELDAQRGVVSDLVRQLAKQLLTGRLNLINISLPVRLFEPRSYLQKLADVWVTPRFLHMAAAESHDPVERLKLVVTFFISGIHLAFSWRKPFNPILGETWQAELLDGTAIFMEQVSHHPPVSAFEMASPPGRSPSWTYQGLSQPDVQAKPHSNVVRTTATGYRRVAFADGGSIRIAYPSYLLHGIIYKSGVPRGELAGGAEFVDERNGLVANVEFGRVTAATDSANAGGGGRLGMAMAGGGVGGNGNGAASAQGVGGTTAAVAAMGGGGHEPPLALQQGGQRQRRGEDPLLMRSDAFSCSIRRLRGALRTVGGGNGAVVADALEAQVQAPSLWSSLSRSKQSLANGSSSPIAGSELASGSGNWLSHLDWDGKRYWTLCEEEYPSWKGVQNPLPSDCSFREDLIALRDGDLAAAQQLKEELEQKQRRDKKMRQEGKAAAAAASLNPK